MTTSSHALLTLLHKVISLPGVEGEQTCVAWAKLTSCEVDSDTYAQTLQEYRHLTDIVQKDISKAEMEPSARTKFTNAVRQVRSAFSSGNLHRPFADARRGDLSEAVLEKLELLDPGLRRLPYPSLKSDDNVKKLLEEFERVLAQVNKSDLAPTFKARISQSLREIIMSLKYCELWGVDSVTGKVSKLIGELVQLKIVEPKSDETISNKLWSAAAQTLAMLDQTGRAVEAVDQIGRGGANLIEFVDKLGQLAAK
jgi:hypothetical protein